MTSARDKYEATMLDYYIGKDLEGDELTARVDSAMARYDIKHPAAALPPPVAPPVPSVVTPMVPKRSKVKKAVS